MSLQHLVALAPESREMLGKKAKENIMMSYIKATKGSNNRAPYGQSWNNLRIK